MAVLRHRRGARARRGISAAARPPHASSAVPVHQYAADALAYIAEQRGTSVETLLAEVLDAFTVQHIWELAPNVRLTATRCRASPKRNTSSRLTLSAATGGRETMAPFAWNIRDLRCYLVLPRTCRGADLVRNLVRLVSRFLVCANENAAKWRRIDQSLNLAGPTGLEPATSGVTGRRSNRQARVYFHSSPAAASAARFRRRWRSTWS